MFIAGFLNILCFWGIPRTFPFLFSSKTFGHYSLHFLLRERARLHGGKVSLFLLDYLFSKIEGLPVIYVDARSTSSLCPMCGGRLKKAPNGHRMLRCCCGYENDRDVIACLNLLRRNLRCGDFRLPRMPSMMSLRSD